MKEKNRDMGKINFVTFFRVWILFCSVSMVGFVLGMNEGFRVFLFFCLEGGEGIVGER